MEKIIVTGKTVEDAVNSAIKQLGTTEDRVNINVLEQPTKRLFGLMGTKNAVVEVELLPEPIDPLKEAKTFLYDVVKTMNLSVQIEQFKQQDQVVFNLVGDNLGMLIGRRGQTLDSLQYLVNIVANRYTENSRLRIVLDAENYRSRRKSTLEDLANKLANKVLKTGKEVVLEPMTPLERKIIHTQLQNHSKVETYSTGEGSNRKVVIKKR